MSKHDRVGEIRKKLSRIRAQTGVWQGCISFDGSEIDTILTAYDEAKEEVEIEIKLRAGLGEINKILSVGLDKLKADNDNERDNGKQLESDVKRAIEQSITLAKKLEKQMADNAQLREAAMPLVKIYNLLTKNDEESVGIKYRVLRQLAEAVKGE